MISNNKKFIFVHAPKTGGSSIEKCLNKFLEEKIIIEGKNTKVRGKLTNPLENSYNSLKHATCTELIKQYGDRFDKFYKFSVIRNPWDRLLSLYYWSTHNKEYDKSLFIKKIFNKVSDVDESKRRTIWTLNKYLCDEDDNLLVDRVMQFDDLDIEFKEIKTLLNISEDIKLPHINKSRKKPNKNILDNEVTEMIADLYTKEINKFWLNYK